MTIHLTVLKGIDGQSNAGALVDYRTECVWNDDFTSFRLVALRWWDDASYACYQSNDGRDEDFPSCNDDGDYVPRAAFIGPLDPGLTPAIIAACDDESDIPF